MSVGPQSGLIASGKKRKLDAEAQAQAALIREAVATRDAEATISDMSNPLDILTPIPAAANTGSSSGMVQHTGQVQSGLQGVNSQSLAAQILNLPMQQDIPELTTEGHYIGTPQQQAQVQTVRGEGEVAEKAKAMINDLCTKILGRQMTKHDTIYRTRMIQKDVWLSTLFIRSLPEPYGKMGFNGERCVTEKDAERSAAQTAITKLSADQSMVKQVIGHRAQPAQPGFAGAKAGGAKPAGKCVVGAKPAGFSPAKPAGFAGAKAAGFAGAKAAAKPSSTGLLVDINPLAPKAQRAQATAVMMGEAPQDPRLGEKYASPEDAAMAAHSAKVREQMMAAGHHALVDPQSAASGAISYGQVLSPEDIAHNAAVDEFIQTHRINHQAATILRESHRAVQNEVVRRGVKSDINHPSGLILRRVAEYTEHFTLLNHWIIQNGVDGDTVQSLLLCDVGTQKGAMRLQRTDAATLANFIESSKAHIKQVEDFIIAQEIDESAAGYLRDSDPAVQRDIMARCPKLKFAQNPSGALIGHLKRSEEHLRSGLIQ